MTPIHYSRNNKYWKNLIGKKGTVIASTRVHVASPGLSAFTPYSYVIVDLGEHKVSLMGAGNDVLEIGHTVECVLRKIAAPSRDEIIPYGIRARKI